MQQLNQEINEYGFILIKNSIPHEKLDQVLTEYLDIVNDSTGRKFDDPNAPELIEFFNDNKEEESKVYEKMLESSAVLKISQEKEIVDPIKNLLGQECGLFKHVPFRIDIPFWTQELAYWHQDHQYVKGNTNTITAWIPFQDTNYIHGCLSIMPKSHLLGIVKHDLKIGKKFVPSDIFNNEIHMVEMKKGDILLLHALLLHSSNLNVSDQIRYSIQPRYTKLNEEIDDGMKGTISL